MSTTISQKNLKLLNETYYQLGKSGGAFSSAKKLWLALNEKIPFNQVKIWLYQQPTHTLFAKRVTKFTRRRIECYSPDDLCEADIMFVSNIYKPHNEDYMGLLTVISCFSKEAQAEPLKTKDASEVVKAFKTCLNRFKHSFKHLRTDEGLEFTSDIFENFCESQKIKHYFAINKRTSGASIVERFNGSLRSILFPAIDYMDTYRWIDHLQDAIKTYNSRFHSSVGMTPMQAKLPKNTNLVKKYLFGELSRYKQHVQNPNYFTKIKIGDYVRAQVDKDIFTHKGEPNYTIEKFIVRDIDRRILPHIYKLAEVNNLPILTVYYRQELQPASPDQTNESYKILVKEIKGDSSLITYVGYPAKFNTWVKTDQISTFVEPMDVD
jgi:hypothetical protein